MYRPTSVTVLAILGIIIGVIGVFCCGLLSLGEIFNLISPAPAEPLFPEGGEFAALFEPPQLPVHATLMFAVQYFFQCLICLYLLVSCVGALNMKNWGRLGMIYSSFLHIGNAIFGGILNAVYLLPDNISKSQSIMGPSGTGDPTVDSIATMIGSAIGILCSLGINCIYPAFVFYFMTRESVVNSFHDTHGGGNFPPGQGGGGYGQQGWQQPLDQYPQAGGYQQYPPQQNDPYGGGGYQQPPQNYPPAGGEQYPPPQQGGDQNQGYQQPPRNTGGGQQPPFPPSVDQ